MPRGRRDLRQGGLFDDPESAPATRAVAPAAVPADLADVARALPDSIRLGTSSWSFPGWRGIVYDGVVSEGRLARLGLGAYAQHPLLRTVGIDRTYYAPVAAATLAAYAAAVPEGFRFLVKAAERCTAPHVRDAAGVMAPNRFYLDPGFAAGEVVAPLIEGLGAKAGPLVFQFPPQGPRIVADPARFAETLGAFLRDLPRGPWYAVELRDRALLTGAFVGAVASAGATPVVSLHARMPAATEQYALAAIDPARPLVVRWMLKAGLAYEDARVRYAPFSKLVDEDPATRDALAVLGIAHAQRESAVFIVVNNKAEGSAPLTVFRLAQAMVARLRGSG